MPSPKAIPTPFGGMTPILGVSHSLQAADDDDPRALKARKVRQEGGQIRSASPADDMSDSGESSSGMFDNINMDALKHRGKGAYSCPKGMSCNRGGVSREGKIVIFDRNSSFV